MHIFYRIAELDAIIVDILVKWFVSDEFIIKVGSISMLKMFSLNSF